MDDPWPQLFRELKALRQCRHRIPADACTTCRGRTASGKRFEEIIEVYRRNGHVVAELEERSSRRVVRRELKTVIGIGLGAGIIGGVLLWQGGKIIWRLIKASPAKEPRGGR
jgi:hypothetical protein